MSQKTYGLLSIYDPSDWVGRLQGGHTGSDTYTAKAESKAELKAVLDGLLKDGKIFQRVVFTTHGNSGVIFFGDDQISPHTLFSDFHVGHYQRLFPFKGAKMYFDGCNVAEGEDGWLFLQAAARTFLRYAGGYALGWTSAGLGLPSFIPFIGSHTIHVWGRARYVFIDPTADGGATVRRFPTDADLAAMRAEKVEKQRERANNRGTLVGGMKF